MDSIIDSLLYEQKRVRELALKYRDPIMEGKGNIPASLMEESLRKAAHAIEKQNIDKMIEIYEELKDYE